MYKKILLIALALISTRLEAQVTVTARFDSSTGKTISNYMFGINVFQGFDPNQAGTPGNTSYKSAMNEMNPGIIRYHSWEMLGTGKNGWLDSMHDWNANKISNALKNSYPTVSTKMINIPSWPADKFGVNSGDTLPKNKYQEFANWCAELVKICNLDNKAGIKYWEVLNERDDTYKNNHAELAVIFNLCASAMKAVDPTIKVGGPAFAQAWNSANLNAFCKGTASTLDFITYHSYTTGNSNETNQNIYNGADIGWVTGTVKAAWKSYSGRTIEFFHDEYNISYSPPDAKQTNYVSQVFDAIAMISLINSGASGAMAWNECDGWYGKMDNSYHKRPSFYLFKNFNTHLIGNQVFNTQVSDPKKVVALTSKNDSSYFVTIVNRADVDLNINLLLKGLPLSVTSQTRVTNFENLKSGGISSNTTTLGELTSSGFISKAGTIALLEIPKDSPTGFNSQEFNLTPAIQLFPNPAGNLVFIKIPDSFNGYEISIKDICGRLMNHLSIQESQYLDISNYSSGIYFLEYVMNGKHRQQKFLKF